MFLRSTGWPHARADSPGRAGGASGAQLNRGRVLLWL